MIYSTAFLSKPSSLFWSAKELANIQTRYAQKGISISEVALCGSKDFVEWRHYPKNDLMDLESGYEFYYHSHPSNEMLNGEHGHFHLFKRDVKNTNQFFHLIGIALNQKGLPVRIFTTNQWVTGESLVPAKTVLKALKGFNANVKGRMGPLARWLSSLTRVFFAEMALVIHERDQKIKKIQLQLGSLSMALSAQNHPVLSECEIHLMNRLSQLLLVTN